MNKIDSYREFVRQLGSTSPIERILKFVIENYILPEMEEELQVRVHFFRFFSLDSISLFPISIYIFAFIIIHYRSLSFIIERSLKWKSVLSWEYWKSKRDQERTENNHAFTNTAKPKQNTIEYNQTQFIANSSQSIAFYIHSYQFNRIQYRQYRSIQFNTTAFKQHSNRFKSTKILEIFGNIQIKSNKNDTQSLYFRLFPIIAHYRSLHSVTVGDCRNLFLTAGFDKNDLT